MTKIRVMHFVSGLVSGGVEQMLVNYCNNMDHDKFEFIVVYQHEPVELCINKIKAAGCKTIRITARNESFVKNIVDSYKIIKEYKPDIIHCHMNLMNFCPAFPAMLSGVKVRISHSHIAEKEKSFIYKIMANICKTLIKISSNVFLSCGQEAGYYLYGKNRSFTIINNAINLEEFRYRSYNFRNSLNLQDKVVVGHVGRFSEQKNHKRLLDIFKEFLKLEKNATLLLAGTGELEESTKKYAASIGIDNNVVFLGPVEDMQGFYSSLDLFVLPSLFEGFPVVALEVQAAGVVSVFSDNIDYSIKITELVHFLNLDESNSELAETMKCLLKQEKCSDYKEKLTQAGYNIFSESIKLEKIYFDNYRRMDA